MKTQFKASFAKDIKTIKNKGILKCIKETIESIEQAKSLLGIPDFRKLKGGGNYYRIRVGEYRVGFVVEGDTIIFVRCLHRKEIYRYFP